MSDQESDKSKSAKNRIRGVKVSLTKLRAAQRDKGFKSQAEVASEIQRIESLDKPPRTLVGRIFRGESVDAVSVERLAKALDVEGWTLYLESQEIPVSETQPDTENYTVIPEKQVVNNRPKWYLGAVFVALFVLLASTLNRQSDTPLPQQDLFTPPFLNLDNKVLVMLTFDGPRGEDLSQVLQEVMTETSQWDISNTLQAGTVNPFDLVRGGNADLVISGQTEKVGRQIIFQILATEGTSTRQIWSGSFVYSASSTYLKNALQDWFRDAVVDNNPPPTVEWPVLKRYANGSLYLQGDRAAEPLLKAMAEFQSVVRLSPDFALGHAGLCTAITEHSVLSGDKDKLAEAEMHCQQAIKLASNNIAVKRALANLTRKKGEFDQAQQQFEQILDLDPNNVDALRTLSEILMRKYARARDNEIHERIESLLEHAKNIEPDNWKVPYTLARFYYFSGDKNKAIEQFTAASNIYPSYQTFSNLGTIEFCAGELEKAKQHYQQALTFQPKNSVLLSNIATLHHYLEEYDQAIAIYQPRLDILRREGGDELYQIWGNIGDAYRMQGDKAKAMEAYREATAALESEVAKGEANMQQQTARLALYLIQADLDPTMYSEKFIENLSEQAESFEKINDPQSLYHMATVWIYLDEFEKARALRNQLGASCPGYAASPGFNVLDKT